MIGIGLSTTISFSVGAVVYTLLTIWQYNQLFQINLAVGLIGIAGLIIITLGFIIMIVGAFFLEKETRIKRFESYDYYKQSKNRERTKKSKTKDLERAEKKKAEKKASKGVAKLQWYAGFGLSFLSGFSTPLLLLSINSVDTLYMKIIVNIPSIPLISGKMLIVNIGLMVGAFFISLLNIALLIARKSYRRLNVFSGGLVAIDGACAGVRYFRILGYVLSIIMAILWYAGIILLVAADTYGPTKTSFHFVCYGFGAIILSIIVSIPMKEYTNTNLKKPVTVVLLSIGYTIIFIGFLFLAFGTAVY